MSNLIEKEELDNALRNNWKFVTKKILEKMCRRKMKALYVGRGLSMHPRMFIGDAEHIYTCSLAFSFGKDNRLVSLDSRKYNLNVRRTMVGINELDYDDEHLIVYSMFYTNSPIRLEKSKFGITGATITPNSIIDASEKAGFSVEEFLICTDLMITR